MTILDILKYPDPRLKQSSEKIDEVDDEIRQFIVDLEQTMRAGPGGVGIAAPQVGRFQQIVIVDVSSRPKIHSHGRMVLINPELTHWEGLKSGREGCMSVPDYTGNVVRAEQITVQALDENGDAVEYQCKDFEARAVQHELDHLHGLLFLDRLVSRRNDLYKRK
jgi:peptide deformylase